MAKYGKNYHKLFLFVFLCASSVAFCSESYGAGLYNMGTFWQARISFGKTWTWVSSSSTYNQSGVYGTKGTGSTSNAPGARYSFGNIGMDGSGNIWLFGGAGYDAGGSSGELNDLWKYTPGNSQWTWVSGSSSVGYGGAGGQFGTQGVGSPSNNPPPLTTQTTWTDASGNFWLFGGFDGAQFRNGLWEFTPGNSQWTWVSGASTGNQNGIYGTKGVGSTSNIPGSRQEAMSWIDTSGNFWIFGGYSIPAGGTFNDLWEYTPGTSQWTWVSGTSTVNSSGHYGTKGVGSTSNYPAARQAGNTWVDHSGMLWLFGGGGECNDLWKFSPTNSQWTWVSGASTSGTASGSFGNIGLASASNIPPQMDSVYNWVDSSGSLWLYGAENFVNDTYNAVWMFSPATSLWTWVAGATTLDPAAVYGVKGVSNSQNNPGGRQGGGVLYNSGTIWLFGGANTTGGFNDLWNAQ
jgi:hypothetical protein